MTDDRTGAPRASSDRLEASLPHTRAAPKDAGVLEMIVRRPGVGEREALQDGQLDPALGLVGDTWIDRASGRTADGTPHPDMQLTIMSARVIAALAGPRERWPLAGDQLYIDMDLGVENVPAGTRLLIGGAVIEIASQPHTGCSKFAERFGVSALRFLNTPAGRLLRLRGIYARVIEAGPIRVGDIVRKLPAPPRPAETSRQLGP